LFLILNTINRLKFDFLFLPLLINLLRLLSKSLIRPGSSHQNSQQQTEYNLIPMHDLPINVYVRIYKGKIQKEYFFEIFIKI